MTPANALPTLAPQVEPATEPKVRPFPVGIRWLYRADFRLDASFHADKVVAAQRTISQSSFPVKLLGNEKVTRHLFWPERFKRIYTANHDEGFPFLQASEVLVFRPILQRWLAKSKAPSPKNYFTKEGWILVTRSGVVGRCVLVGKRLAQFYLSEDLIRLIPTLPAGYLYAFLSTWMGQALMIKEQYGGTISHLEPQHLRQLPVPLLPEVKQQAIHEQIMKACALRDEANDLLDKADELLHRELGLLRFDESQVSYLGGVSNPKAFSVKASELAQRLDASFHHPIAKAAIQQLYRGKYPPVRLGDGLCTCLIAPRFKRIYVGPEYGVPFLQGSHIPMMKPYDLKYLSRRAHADLSPWIIRKGWVLVTCSGTVGRVALVPEAMDGWAASQHIERIVANPQRLHGGYLAAFLMTPYGQYQLLSKVHGGVVDEITEDDTANIYLPDAPLGIQREIGTLVAQAFEKKEEANLTEAQCIDALEKAITGGKTELVFRRTP